jgi:molecular chaperone DnaK (HSP70)
MTIKVYKGKSSWTGDNNLFGIFYLKDITPIPRGVPQIEMTFDINSNEIMNITVQKKSIGNVKKIMMKKEDYYKNRLTRWFQMQKSSRSKMKRLRRELNRRMDLKGIYLKFEIH